MNEHQHQELDRKLSEMIEKESYKEAERLLNNALRDTPDDPGLFLARAKLYRQIQRFSEAINDLQHVLKLDPDHREAGNLLELTHDILRYQKLDIYACTNLHNDPWLE